MYCTVINHDGHLRTRRKWGKLEPQSVLKCAEGSRLFYLFSGGLYYKTILSCRFLQNIYLFIYIFLQNIYLFILRSVITGRVKEIQNKVNATSKLAFIESRRFVWLERTQNNQMTVLKQSISIFLNPANQMSCFQIHANKCPVQNSEISTSSL